MSSAVAKFGLQSTLRDRGHPKKGAEPFPRRRETALFRELPHFGGQPGQHELQNLQRRGTRFYRYGLGGPEPIVVSKLHREGCERSHGRHEQAKRWVNSRANLYQLRQIMRKGKRNAVVRQKSFEPFFHRLLGMKTSAIKSLRGQKGRPAQCGPAGLCAAGRDKPQRGLSYRVVPSRRAVVTNACGTWLHSSTSAGV